MGRVAAVGTVKWRERKQITAGELAHAATARAVVPSAEQARLLTVCPAGLHEDARPDLALTPADLLAAWR